LYRQTNSMDLHPGDLQSFRDYILTSNSIVLRDDHRKAALASASAQAQPKLVEPGVI
jgi:hypothetical protein